ncbi:MAG: dephospho-CoA kinase [Balneolaceae bacterium]|nr:MAG: dephospho-CoA kinase [Balneolaceae bacterium]
MIKVGITGAIGSGKTTVCNIWKRLGAAIFFADDEAKKLMVTDEKVRGMLINTFGSETFIDNHTLNKPYLIHEAFTKGRVAELNAIVHPAVGAAFELFCRDSENKGVDVAVKEAALLLNNGRPQNLDFVVIVESVRKIRLNRVMNRDNIDEKKFFERDENQPHFESLHHLADEILINNGSLAELEVKSKKLFQKLLKINLKN